MRIKFSLNVNLYNLTLTKDLYYGDGSWTSRASPPWRCGSPSRGRRPGQDQSSCSSQRSAGEAESVFIVKVKIIIMTECKKVKVKISVWLQKECKITCELSSAWLNPPPGAPFSSPSSKIWLFFGQKWFKNLETPDQHFNIYRENKYSSPAGKTHNLVAENT